MWIIDGFSITKSELQDICFFTSVSWDNSFIRSQTNYVRNSFPCRNSKLYSESINNSDILSLRKTKGRKLHRRIPKSDLSSFSTKVLIWSKGRTQQYNEYLQKIWGIWIWQWYKLLFSHNLTIIWSEKLKQRSLLLKHMALQKTQGYTVIQKPIRFICIFCSFFLR